MTDELVRKKNWESRRTSPSKLEKKLRKRQCLSKESEISVMTLVEKEAEEQIMSLSLWSFRYHWNWNTKPFNFGSYSSIIELTLH